MSVRVCECVLNVLDSKWCVSFCVSVHVSSCVCVCVCVCLKMFAQAATLQQQQLRLMQPFSPNN